MKIIIISLLVFFTTAASAEVFRYGSGNTGYDFNTDANINYNRQIVEISNYRTGQIQDVRVQPNGIGGYSGWDVDIQTGKVFDVDVDSSGNVDIWEY